MKSVGLIFFSIHAITKTKDDKDHWFIKALELWS